MDQHRKPRVFLADDHILVAEACANLLKEDFEIAGIVGDGRSLLKEAPPARPDVVVLDVAMPQLNGLDAGEQLKHLLPSVKLVYMTMNAEPEVAAEAFRRGACGYVLKASAAEELLIAVRRALHGQSYLSPLITKDTVNFLLRSGKAYAGEKQITRRQREVLQLLAEGKSMKEIAGVLNLQPGTVAFHKYRIMESLGLKTNAELLQYAIRRHLIPA